MQIFTRHGSSSFSFEETPQRKVSFTPEQWPKPWLFPVHKGLNTTQLYWDHTVDGWFRHPGSELTPPGMVVSNPSVNNGIE